MLLTEKSHTTYIQQSKSTVMVAASCLTLRWLLLGVSASASALQVLDEMPKRAFRYAVVSQPCFLLRSQGSAILSPFTDQQARSVPPTA